MKPPSRPFTASKILLIAICALAKIRGDGRFITAYIAPHLPPSRVFTRRT